jgi:hypothetical protein
MKHSIRSRNHIITGLVDAVLQHAGRQHAQSCVDENEPWSATDLHVGMAAARPSQEELQFCLAAAQQPRPQRGRPLGILWRVDWHRARPGSFFGFVSSVPPSAHAAPPHEAHVATR